MSIDRTVHRVTTAGHYVEDVRVGLEAPTPDDCVDTQPPAGMGWPRYVAGAWVDAGIPYSRDPDTGALLFPSQE